MSTPRGFRDRADDSLLSLVGELPELIRNLVVAEIDSAKAWLKRTGKDAGLGGAWFIVALFFLFWTIPAIGAFAIIGLSSWLAPWLSALIVIGILVLAAIVFALLGWLRFKKLSSRQNPAQALSADAKIVKDVADEF
ncbi:phage holin family protein [Microbacterium radiodurans]|uniref:Phage holin family protein n=1 Tax=Microbacterium radiodurans TaxID=661398 RepID=A0A5J5IY73_9MICO|nr:phage holin family protein [Microbacterium radiodurans]KAA9089510.1 phage holin family protein [Microbacterium radiodurans]